MTKQTSKMKKEEIYIEAIQLARNNNQVVGEKNDFYITLEQLEFLLK